MVGSRLEPTEAVPLLIPAGDHDDGDARRVCVIPKEPAYVVTVHLGHLNIEKDDIRPFGIDEIDRLDPVRSEHKMAALVSQRIGHYLLLSTAIVGNENLGVSAHFRPARIHPAA